MAAFFSGLESTPGAVEKYLGRVIADARLREDSSIREIVRDWAKYGFKDTVNWLESLDEKHRGQQLWQDVIVGGAENDFELATSYLSKVPGDDLPDALADIAGVMQRNQSHEAALDWMTGYRPEEIRISDFGILSQWSAEDPESAKNWLLRFSPGDQEVRDCALEAYVRSSNDFNHEGTLKMAQDIKSTELQKRALKSALLKWKREDAEAARQWVDQFAGAEGMKEELNKLFMEKKRQ